MAPAGGEAGTVGTSAGSTGETREEPRVLGEDTRFFIASKVPAEGEAAARPAAERNTNGDFNTEGEVDLRSGFLAGDFAVIGWELAVVC